MADPVVSPDEFDAMIAAAQQVPQEEALSDDELSAILFAAQTEQDAARLATPPRKIGRAEALVRGANQGATMGFADELLGAVESRFPSLAQMPGDVLADVVYPETVPQSRRAQQAPTYEEARNAQRALEAETLAQRPGSYLTGQVAGGIATSRRLPAGFASNVAQGAVQGVGDTEAEDAGGMLEGAARGAAFAGGADLAGRAVGKYILPAAMSRLRAGLEKIAVGQGRRALENSASVLRGTEPVSEEAILQALRDRAIRAFSTAEGASGRLKDLASQRGAAYNAILEGLEQQGVRGPNAEALAKRLAEEAESALKVSGANTAVPDLFEAQATATRERAPSAFRLVEEGVEGPKMETLGLQQAEGIKRNLQKEAKYGRWEETPLNEAKREVASIYRQSIEDAVETAGREAPEGSTVRELAEEFVPAKRTLARTLEARAAAKRGASRGANRSAIGLPDYIMAAGAAPSGPLAQTLVGALTNQARQRGASTVADVAYQGSRAAGALTRESINNPRTVQEWMARLLAVPSRQEVLAEYLRSRNRQPPTTQE